MQNLPTIILLALLIVCIGFFTSSETAFLSLSKLKIRTMVQNRKRNAKLIFNLKNKIDQLLTTVLIGTNLLNSLASALATAFAVRLLNGSSYVNLTPFITAFFITTFGQIIPKTVASIHPDIVAQYTSIFLRILEILFFPIVWIFTQISHLVVMFVEKIVKNDSTIISEEELQTLISVGETEGTLEKSESKMLNRLIKFNDLTVNDIMKHRSFVKMVNINLSYQELIKEFLDSRYSTLAVYKDSKENVVGVVHYQDVIYSDENADLGFGYVEKIMTDVIYVPGTFTVLEILNRLRAEEYKFAVVLNEQGETAGIITMEDIIRVVFDRMTNENIYEDIPPEDKIQLVSLNTFLVPGDLRLDDINEILNMNLESESFMTIGGWLLEQFGFLPSIGEVFIKDHTIFIVEDIVQRRITSIRIKTKA